MIPRLLPILIFGIAVSLFAGCGPSDDEVPVPATRPAILPATQPAPLPTTRASADELDAAIAERGSLTFLSWNGTWIGSDVDTDITFLPGGDVHMFEYSDAMIGYRGTYAIDSDGNITLDLPTYEYAWPTMALLRDDQSFLLTPTDGSGGKTDYWPFRPIPASAEAVARQDIKDRGGK